MIDRNKVIKLSEDIESSTFQIGQSDSLIKAEGAHHFLKLFIENKISEEDFLNNISEELSCPPEPFDDYCIDAEGHPCKDCWERFFSQNINEKETSKND